MSGFGTGKFTPAQLDEFRDANDFHIAVYKDNGSTGTPTWIRCVVVDGDPYIRSYRGTKGKWYNAALKNPRGPIVLSGRTWEVAFEPVDDHALLDKISDEYVRKYVSGADGMYVAHMNAPESVQATMRVVPVV